MRVTGWLPDQPVIFSSSIRQSEYLTLVVELRLTSTSIDRTTANPIEREET